MWQMEGLFQGVQLSSAVTRPGFSVPYVHSGVSSEKSPVRSLGTSVPAAGGAGPVCLYESPGPGRALPAGFCLFCRILLGKLFSRSSLMALGLCSISAPVYPEAPHFSPGQLAAPF